MQRFSTDLPPISVRRSRSDGRPARSNASARADSVPGVYHPETIDAAAFPIGCPRTNEAAHDAHAIFQSSPTITIRSGSAALRLTLWDEDQHRLVAFRDVTLT